MMKNILRKGVGTLALALLMAASLSAQTRSVARTNDPLAALPASDAVMFLDMNRVLTELLPRTLAGNAERLAQVNADLERFRARTGIDPRTIDRVAVGTRYVKAPSGATQLEPVAIARGRFNASTITAAGRLAAQGKYAERKYGGRTIYVFTIAEQLRMFGLLRMNVGELAITALDANTLAIGKPDVVQTTIDAARGKRADNSALIALANRNPNAVMGFGGSVPAGLIDGIELGNPEFNRALSSVRQVSGSLGTNAGGYEMLLTARTTGADAARSLNETVDAARGLAGFVIGNLQGDRGRLARNALQSLRVNVENADVNLRVALAEADVATLVRGL